MNADKNIIDKLKYLGLNLNKIPKEYKEYKTLDFRPSKYGDERNYKVYKYLDVKNIEILLSPTNRMCDISEKYSKAAPLIAYLEPQDEKDLERHSTFLKMLSTMDKEKVEEIEKEQKELNKKIPFGVKYPKNYLWQIYYSEYTNKYFMIVTTEDLEYSAFFYLLKAKANKKGTKIFVPISYLDYSNEFLDKSELEEIEKYICFFTKEWPQIYEIYDENDKATLQITGDTFVYDNIKSKYKIKLNKKDEAQKFYKLLKAIFILQTGLSHYYKFDLKIDYRGNLNFYYKGKKIIYEILSSFIKEEYIKAEELDLNIVKEKTNLEKEIKELKQESQELDLEFIEKEKQISTFLQCKKTFFGRVKYFFKSKKVLKPNITNKEKPKEKKENLEYVKYEEIKEHYTLEELVNLYKKIEQNQTNVNNLKLDIKALKTRIENIKSKIKNANQYIEEIEKHKKSIFEFWKFTNKDKVSELMQGELKEEKGHLKKVFNYDLDFEDVSRNLDKLERNLLSADEINSIFVAINLLEDVNTVLEEKKISKDRFEQVKKYASEQKMLFNEEKFDIFGAIETNSSKLKTLANKKHRETKRELFKIIDINQNTTLEEYMDLINKTTENVKSAIGKINSKIELSIYTAKDDLDLLNVFYINPENAIKEFRSNLEDETNLYKIKINEDTPILALTNIVYYNNNNKTLPLGMNVSCGILLDNSLIKLKEIKKDKFNIIAYENPEDEMSKILVKKINVIEYEIEK